MIVSKWIIQIFHINKWIKMFIGILSSTCVWSPLTRTIARLGAISVTEYFHLGHGAVSIFRDEKTKAQIAESHGGGSQVSGSKIECLSWFRRSANTCNPSAVPRRGAYMCHSVYTYKSSRGCIRRNLSSGFVGEDAGRNARATLRSVKIKLRVKIVGIARAWWEYGGKKEKKRREEF